MTPEQQRAFIADKLPLAPAPGVPEIQLHLARPSSGLYRLLGDDDTPPYWAYVWGGGAVLARHVLDNPAVVAGKRVLDLGAGGGIVAIAAAMSDAKSVRAAEIDANGRAAIQVNSDANRVSVGIVAPSAEVPQDVDLILAGDVFYDPAVAGHMLAYLQRCQSTGIEILIGDPFRKPLPLDQLVTVAAYSVPDFGSSNPVPAAVFTLKSVTRP